MKIYSYERIYLLLLLFVMGSLGRIFGQKDSISRNVTVERVYQPFIQTTSKVEVQPEAIEYKSEAVKVNYSDSSYSYPQDAQMQPIVPSKESFENMRKNFHGRIEAGGGYADTYFDFLYQIRDSKKSALDIFVNHNAYWGLKTVERTAIGLDFTHDFAASQVFFGLNGSNDFFTYYGRYFNEEKGKYDAKWKDLTSDDKRSLWNLDAFLGVRASRWNEFQYELQIGYHLLRYQSVAENIIHTKAKLGWQGDIHSGGVNVDVQNGIYSLENAYKQQIDGKVKRHAIRIEPFYGLRADRFIAHFGVNLDINLGSGKMLSGKDDISFAPSPNVDFELFITKTWLSFYGKVKGQLMTNFLKNDLYEVRYLNDVEVLRSKHLCGYTPIDATAGFNIKAYKTLLIDLHLGYAYLKNQRVLYSDTFRVDNPNRFLDFGYMDYTRFKAGLAMSFHYKDIVKMRLTADYFALKRKSIELSLDDTFNSTTVFDQPSWNIGLKGDFKITPQWTLYTENTIFGPRKALACDREWIVPSEEPNGEPTTMRQFRQVNLKAFVDINVGVRYELGKYNLGFFLQLNNLICRYNDLYFTYKTPGINGLAGVIWKF